MPTKLEKIKNFKLFKILFNKNPTVAIFQIEQRIKDQMEETINTHFNDLKDKQGVELQEAKKNALEAVQQAFEASKSSFKGAKGDTPTKEEIKQATNTFLLENVELFKGKKGDSIKGEKGDSVKGERGERGEMGIGERGEKGNNGSPDTPDQ